ncbi:hypothetical protein N9V79_01265 [Candidatus Pelagibacter bacterium]|jgi:hypothetical protein|nr:hypothetical protein [Candidatus Pelagibacter bacterium]|tara:strand:+ start:112 stop:531 length:420 start_codon:yes stop_codon:yes gene_type:complete
MTDTPDEKQTTVASNNKYNNNNNINNTIPIKVPLKVAPPRDKSKDFVQDYYMMSTAMCCKVAGKVGIYIYSYLKWRKGMDKKYPERANAYYPIPNVQSHDWGDIRRQRKNEAIEKMLKAELISVKKEKGKSTKVRLLIK